MSTTLQQKVQQAEIARTVKFEGEAADEFAALCADYRAAKDLIKELTTQKEQAEVRIREMMGEADTAYVGKTLHATIAQRNRSNVDKKKLEAGWPEALVACTTNTVYTVLDAQ